MSLNNEVVKIIERGIEVSRKQKNTKAANELRSLLDEID
jgi:hypothetical protein